jgi:hypothetical protein
MSEQTVERLKNEWQAAKKAADSLSIAFPDIEAARRREADARRRYTQAVQAQEA